MTLSFDDKTAINIEFQRLYDEACREGKHGHYETMFEAMHKAYETHQKKTLVGRLCALHERLLRDRQKPDSHFTLYRHTDLEQWGDLILDAAIAIERAERKGIAP